MAVNDKKNLTLTSFCLCDVGLNGSLCEINIDDCVPYPCQNGGQCQDGVDSYTCLCSPGFQGYDCDIDIDECQPNPCQNGGQCQDGVDSYTCLCNAGFEGQDCEIESPSSVSVVIDCVRYLLYDLRKAWNDANAHCESMGGTLAKIRGQAETDRLLSWMSTYYPSVGGFWIGLKASDANLRDPDAYIWEADGTTVGESGYRNWKPGEPNSASYRCIRMIASFDFKWGDYNCSNLRRYLCEVNAC
ncbi:versican core protein-like [Ptychodera flava]|uniref:versican core protein-like n=1 Tax=Ptychodera flava TaxID=63121 RepID=UPI00396AAD91